MRSVKLLTNNPKKIRGLEESGISVKERLEVRPDHWNSSQDQLDVHGLDFSGKEVDQYLITKIKRMQHLISVPCHLSHLIEDAGEVEDASTDCSN